MLMFREQEQHGVPRPRPGRTPGSGLCPVLCAVALGAWTTFLKLVYEGLGAEPQGGRLSPPCAWKWAAVCVACQVVEVTPIPLLQIRQRRRTPAVRKDRWDRSRPPCGSSELP